MPAEKADHQTDGETDAAGLLGGHHGHEYDRREQIKDFDGEGDVELVLLRVVFAFLHHVDQIDDDKDGVHQQEQNDDHFEDGDEPGHATVGTAVGAVATSASRA